MHNILSAVEPCHVNVLRIITFREGIFTDYVHILGLILFWHFASFTPLQETICLKITCYVILQMLYL